MMKQSKQSVIKEKLVGWLLLLDPFPRKWMRRENPRGPNNLPHPKDWN